MFICFCLVSLIFCISNFFPPRWEKLRYIRYSINRKTNGQLLCFLFLFNYISMHNISKITKIYSKLIFIPKGTGYTIHDIGVATLDYVQYGMGHLNHSNSSAGNFSGRVVMISASFVQMENVAVMARCFDARSLQWCHNGGDGVSNHQRLDYLLKSLFRCRSKKHESSETLALVRGIHRWPLNSPHKGPKSLKMFPFDGVIMCVNLSLYPECLRQAEIIKFWVQIPCSFIPFIVSSCAFVHLLGTFHPWKRGLLLMINASCCKSKDQPILAFLLRLDFGASCNCEIFIKTFFCGYII